GDGEGGGRVPLGRRARVVTDQRNLVSPRRRETAFRCRQLLDAHEERWLDPPEAFERDWAWARGFVETFTTTPADLDHAHAALFETNPFRRAWLWELDGRVEGAWLLPRDNRITALDLIGNNLNVRELKKLAKLPHLSHLRELGLMFNDLRDTSVKVLCGEPFFNRLDLIRLGANPLTARGRDQLRAHFGARVTFAHEREPDRLYTIQDDRLLVGWGSGFTQLYLRAGEAEQRVAVFDHAGNLLRTETRPVDQQGATGYDERNRRREAVRDAWLAELGYQSATIKVKAFRLPGGPGLTPFNWWADVFDGSEPEPYPNFRQGIGPWFEDGQYRIDFGGDDNWFDRTGEVTDT
ncbi:MAG: hypothetical protein K2V38_04230, partial [Gemmataceae bacterium]|nr:hypothetical protein [Gemmataceae bacterium]